MSKLVQLGAIAAAVAALVGCSGAHYTLTDDVDLTWDFLSLPTRFDAALHAPYVLGTKVTLFARSSDDHEDLSGFTIVTSDAAVFRVDDAVLSSDRREIAVHGHAMSEGTATLTVVDARGHAVGHGAAEVLAPDRIDVSAHGSLILGREDEARVSEIRTVTSGLATYLVRYARDGRELHGNGVLMVDAPAQVAADVRTTFLFENREWLAVRSTAAAATSITLRTPGSPAVVVPIVTVPETAIADLVLLTQPERDRHDGDWLVALAQAYDAAGQRVFGVDCTWKIDGVAQTGDGDLYRYRYKAGQLQQVQAQRGAHSDAIMIQSDTGYVSSSNGVGCAAGGGGGSLGLGLGLAGLVARGRRRR